MGSYAEILGATVLADLVYVARDLRQLSRQSQADAARAFRNLLVLEARFEDLTAAEQVLNERLNRGVALPPVEIPRLINYAERFLGELIIASEGIAEAIRD